MKLPEKNPSERNMNRALFRAKELRGFWWLRNNGADLFTLFSTLRDRPLQE